MSKLSKEFYDLLLNYQKEKIPNKDIRRIWRTFRPIKKMPKIEGFIVGTEEFYLFIKVFKTILSRIGVDPDAGKKREYGEVTPPILHAFVSGINDVFYIFLDRNSDLPTYDSLKHEIEHIYKGDSKAYKFNKKEEE